MTSLYQKKGPLTTSEHIVKYSLMYLRMKNVKPEAIDKIMSEAKSSIIDFEGPANFLFVMSTGSESISFSTAMPAPSSIKKKCIVCVKARDSTDEPGFTCIADEIIFMEICRPVLDNLYQLCNDVYLPVLRNPLNQIGWSELVSKDLMEKFNTFISHTYVTIGQQKGRTMLPVPPAETTGSASISSKEKSNTLENAINQWTKQIKTELKKVPENALKNNQHPDPMVEVEFWENRSENLNSICEQLGGERIKKVLKFLEQNKSTQISAFLKLQKEVQLARAESSENFKYLKTLQELFLDLKDTSRELNEVAELFVPIMHTILLIWTYSTYYNTPSRLLVLIREICNAVIDQCKQFVNGERVFEAIKANETFDAHKKLILALDVCSSFKDAYFDYKSKSKNTWKISSNALFVRLDAFSERCQNILQLTGTVQQFSKLTKIEVGNTKGATMSSSIESIYQEFDVCVSSWYEVKYDIINIEERQFEDDFYKFRKRINELERRTSAVLTQSFDDCDTLIGKFKLLESFDGLLTRPIIAQELEKKQGILLQLYKDDLATTLQIFQDGKQLIINPDTNNVISSNMPPIAGAINWTSGLYERIREPMDRLQLLPQSIHDREDFVDVHKMYSSLCKQLKEFEDEKIIEWESDVEENTTDQLKKFLLVREETDLAPEGFVRVNFDPILTRLLREVRYLQLLDIKVPERARNLFKNVDIYRSQTGNLDLIVEMYNDIISTLLPVEKPLLQARITKIDKFLQPGINQLIWTSENIPAFINTAMKIVKEVDELVKKMKENVKKMIEMMDKWQKPLYERKVKTLPPEDVEQMHTAQVTARFEQIKTEGKEIAKLMKDTIDNVKPDKKSAQWLAYVDYVNGLVVEGITNGIDSSMTYVAEQVSINYNKTHLLQPIFDVKVTLRESTVTFDPPIECSEYGNGIRDIINTITNHFISLAIQMPSRLDMGGGDYLVEIKDQFQLFGTLEVISNNMDEIEDASVNFLEQFNEIKFLWEEELEASFEKFLSTGIDPREVFIASMKNQEEEIEDEALEVELESYDAMAAKILNGVVAKQPSLDQFDEKITLLTEVKNKIDNISAMSDIGWIRADCKPLIKDVQALINSWIDRFTLFLLNNTMYRLNNMVDFINKVKTGIKTLPVKNDNARDKKLLTEVMTHLRDVNQIKEKTLGLIGPMRDTVALLKKHAVPMQQDYFVLLENSKTDLIETADKALGPTKEAILPLQSKEANNVKDRRRKFQIKVLEYRREFQDKLPYNVAEVDDETISRSYESISEYYLRTGQMEDEAKELQMLESLFDLQRTNYKELKDCKVELVQLKKLWDLIALIDLQFANWKMTLWDQIDTDELEVLIKEMLTKQANPTGAQNKDIKQYKAFMCLNDRVKNMNQLRPLIQSLHSKYMMDRHWKKLQVICDKTVPYSSPKFCLNDLIEMELHKFVDDVNELVDGAAKEAKIDVKLTAIEKTWEDFDFEFKEYKETAIMGALDEIVENVETQSMELMTMIASKDSEEFKTQLHKWQKILKTVDSVIAVWMKTQKAWMRLEPIFLASEDIRAQLPEDTKRFEKVDLDWKTLMAEAVEDPGVVNCSCAEGREELIKSFGGEIELCERALHEYLEQKKKIFPRFYFVSNQALLDILSNGNNPEKVNSYVGDCFTGMKKMQFNEDANQPRPYKQATGMWSKDNELVHFDTDFNISGAVELYLCELERKMMSTLQTIMIQCKESTDEWVLDKPREMWIDNYCAQLALLATQIVYTEETTRVFDDLESGSEGAMKDYLLVIKGRIGKLITRVRMDLDRGTRDKVITIITIDVHSRDVTDMFVNRKIVDSGAFQWASQLKFYFEKKTPKSESKEAISRICDWHLWYQNEFIGNTGRLVITPLTDRCYITLTQALNLTLGGAPAGPAGTGKTETVKDLSRALGVQVVVFNGSEQMTYITVGLIFMGLSQAGCWGCFDEFNRISIEVLSVVSTQIKYCLDAIKLLKADPTKTMFMFEDEEIGIKIAAGYFITMNPGYAGRTELPENLKAFFRSCAMVVPDIVLICENMLMAEGFQEAKDLSKKFMELYDLAKSLLSPQMHYDWGLRAVKSVLRQAGNLKRADPDGDEYKILMRALRDFNLPKIVLEDRKIFLDLINDLFPNMNPERAVNMQMQEACEKAAIDCGLLADQGFVQKMVDTCEILLVRHSMFILGNAGSAKSTIWQTLVVALTKYMDHLTVFEVVDPKACSGNELYGAMNAKTKEWKDGILAAMMRDMSRNEGKYKPTHKYKWVVLDGDVDAVWIESMNTVMDDNKTLTLVSQERIPFASEMRLMIETGSLKNASPATVSRGGVLFVNESDIGWKPMYDIWNKKYKDEKNDELAATSFTLFQQTYCSDAILEDLKGKSKIAPINDIAQFQSLFCIIDYLYAILYSKKDQLDHIKRLKEDGNEEAIKTIYEGFFVYAFIWSFGGTLSEDKLSFSNMLKGLSKIKFPEGGQVYDYYFNAIEMEFMPWSETVEPFDTSYDGLYINLVVPTAETNRQSNLIDIHKHSLKGVMFVGIAGTGKTTIIKNYFNHTDPETVVTGTINFNSYTDSFQLQQVFLSNVEKRTGRINGPPLGKKLMFFVDDINMPMVETYGSQGAVCLLRQLIDYDLLFNRNELSETFKLVDYMVLACMNPKSGSFTVDLRCTRHLTQIALSVPEKDILLTIYQQILHGHLENFDDAAIKFGPKLVSATQILFNSLANSVQFMPTAMKFHYQFNMRDFARIIQNVLLSQASVYRGNNTGLARMWAHECQRVWYDRLLFPEDQEAYSNFMKLAMKEMDMPEAQIMGGDDPLIFTSFVSVCKGHEAAYKQVVSYDDLKSVLEDKLEEYNEMVQTMELVLFNQAMEHITRIARILFQPCGNALLVGVGGSGKQSLSKLASFILNFEMFRIVVTTQYSLNDLKTDIQTLFMKTGVQGIPSVFLLTDSQIIDNRYLVFINDILSSGYIPELFAKDEVEEIQGKVRNEAKSLGYADEPGPLFEFFLNKVRNNLHIDLCFSPVGEAFRYRARQFPGIINDTSIDWFTAWPEDALVGVAARFLGEVEFPSDEIRAQVGQHMANVHLSIDKANQEYKEKERRFNYTTPTSYLELIAFYKSLLGKKRGIIEDQISRLEQGLNIMERTTDRVGNLRKELDIKMVDVEIEKVKTNELIEIVGEESNIAEKEEAIAKEQEEATNIVANNADAAKASAEKELEQAVPAMLRAKKAVDCLEKEAIVEFKGFNQAPPGTENVTNACLIMVKFETNKKNLTWAKGQQMMKDPHKFLESLYAFDKNNISDQVLKNLQPILALDYFNYEAMIRKSSAAANLANWVINIVEYNRIFRNVEPLRITSEEAEELATRKKAELKVVQEKVAEIVAKVNELKEQLKQAEEKLNFVNNQAEKLRSNLDLASRLVNGLADENVRWAKNVEVFRTENLTMIGNALVSAAFVSYIGPFSFKYRCQLWKEVWLLDIAAQKIPITDGVDPLYVLSTAAQQAVWQTQSLPADRVSLENAAVISSCSRYPLIIDPQLQGIRWIRCKEGDAMISIQLNQKNWMKKVELAVGNGQVLMIESIGIDIDAVLDPLLSRQFVKKGKALYVKLGAEDVEVLSSFKFYLQTKLINPHYKPETAAQCTIINFIVTEDGLEDQLLAMVVKVEKPELEATKEELTHQQNQFKIQLEKLESDLLNKLSDADPATILENIDLIEGLEVTKKTSLEIQAAQEVAVKTEQEINESREMYRRVSAEGAMLYFLLIKLCVIDSMYQYSLSAFTYFFFKAIEKTAQFENEEDRVTNMRATIRMVIYQWVSRGLFEKHKLVFLVQLTFRLMQKKIFPVDYTAAQMTFFIMGPLVTGQANPVKKWLPDVAWCTIQAMIQLEGFEKFSQNMVTDAPKRFEDWYNHLTPEDQTLPLEWRALDDQLFQKMIVVRALRPDRCSVALFNFIKNTLPNGDDYVNCDSSLSFLQVLDSAYRDSSPTTPIYFILSAGANPVKDVEALTRIHGFDTAKMLHPISLGQGQDVIANAKLDHAHKEGHWVLLQNVHLMPRYLIELEDKLAAFAAEGSDPNFRLLLTSEASPEIPIGLLEKSIKITSEPPQGMSNNLKRAFTFFDKNEFEDKDNKLKTILFALCYFHAMMIERRKFGSKGFNQRYPFNIGDLRDSSIVLQNYLDQGSGGGKIPWDDLRYIFGEIMYGGHIVDDWDRVFCNGFLRNLMNDSLLDEANMFPFTDGTNVQFKCPPAGPYEKYVEYIDTELPPESPLSYGMHPNAEIDFRTKQCLDTFDALIELQPKEGGSSEEGVATVDSKVAEFNERVMNEACLESNKLNVDDIVSKLSEDMRGPYQNTFIQECELINNLIAIIIRSLQDIELANKGELTRSEAMEKLMEEIYMNRVPTAWMKLSFETTRGLGSWLDNIKQRLEQLNTWKEQPDKEPPITFLNRLYNPRSFLTAVKQVMSREKSLELNKLYIVTEIQKKMYWQIAELSKRDGAFIFGMQVEGARWDQNSGLEESEPKKNFSVLPVVLCRAVMVTDKEEKGIYMCPTYKTETRGKTFVFTAQLKTKHNILKWCLAGVAIILDVEGVSDAFQAGKEPPV